MSTRPKKVKTVIESYQIAEYEKKKKRQTKNSIKRKWSRKKKTVEEKKNTSTALKSTPGGNV